MFPNSWQILIFEIQKGEIRIPKNSRNRKFFLKYCKNCSYSLFIVMDIWNKSV